VQLLLRIQQNRHFTLHLHVASTGVFVGGIRGAGGESGTEGTASLGCEDGGKVRLDRVGVGGVVVVVGGGCAGYFIVEGVRVVQCVGVVVGGGWWAF